MGSNASFRDFLGYLLPGSISLFVFLHWLGSQIISETDVVEALDSGLTGSIVFIAGGFTLGYVQSRIPLYVFNVMYKENWLARILPSTKNHYSLNDVKLHQSLKDQIATRLKAAYNLEDVDRASSSVFFMCL